MSEWRPDPVVLDRIFEHAEASAPRECCGVIVGGEYWQLINRATEHDAFVMDLAGYTQIARQHRIEAIVHSHCHAPAAPSDADRVVCERTGVPWLVVSWPSRTWEIIEPCGWQAPLVGRQWAWGTLDCLELVRDTFRRQAGIEIPEYEREWNWWREGGDLIVANFAHAGFEPLPPGTAPKHLDVLGMRLGARVVNHLALFVEPDQILHQLMGKLSVQELYDGTYQSATVLHLRHRDLA